MTTLASVHWELLCYMFKPECLCFCRRWTSMRSWGWLKQEKVTRDQVPQMNFYLSLRYLQVFFFICFITVQYLEIYLQPLSSNSMSSIQLSFNFWVFSLFLLCILPQVANFSSMEESTPEFEDKPIRDWDDIIPEEQRRKIEEEEKQREMDIFMLPRSRSSNKRVRRELQTYLAQKNPVFSFSSTDSIWIIRYNGLLHSSNLSAFESRLLDF